ncbi:MAG: family acetyltransferase [Chloroflexi bacterium]|nr:family acetyltransferase [Chloroflexota bacterium]
MMLDMPILETKRLIIRPFVMEDLEAVYQLLDVELDAAVLGTDKMHTLAERAEWLQWAVLNPTQLAKLHQPPYGDRAIVLRSNGKLIGACGFVPCLNVYEQLPGFAPRQRPPGLSRYSTEFGLFYAISPQYQRQGYAFEAAQALVDYAFQQLRLKQIIAETDYNNLGSMGVMRKLGMRIEKNPYSEPPWLQVVGVLEAS